MTESIAVFVLFIVLVALFFWLFRSAQKRHRGSTAANDGGSAGPAGLPDQGPKRHCDTDTDDAGAGDAGGGDAGGGDAGGGDGGGGGGGGD